MSNSLSIVIPAYNEEELLPRCLASLMPQARAVGAEVIVVDNTSSDGTADLARSFGARVIVEPARGTCAARQAGTHAARGSIVISTDADTIFPPDWLARVQDSMSADPNIVAVSGPCQYLEAPWWGSLYARLLFGSVNALYRLTGKVWYVSACNLAFRKASWSGYNTKLTQGGDEFDLLGKLKKQGQVNYLPENPVLTSSRRMSRGFLYNMVVTIFWLYLVNYGLGAVMGKSVLGSYPAIRMKKTMSVLPRWVVLGSATAILVFVAVFFVSAEPTFARVLVRDIGHHLHSMGQRVAWRR